MVDPLDFITRLDIRYSLKYSRAAKKKGTPLDILKRRFANSEITKEQFEECKRILQQN